MALSDSLMGREGYAERGERRPVLFVRPGTSETVLSETDKGGSRAGILADRLRHMADQLDAMVVT